jgi:hypothetical protein
MKERKKSHLTSLALHSKAKWTWFHPLKQIKNAKLKKNS